MFHHQPRKEQYYTKSVSFSSVLKGALFYSLIKFAKCGHSHSFYTSANETIIKADWNIDPLGNKY